MGFPDAGLSSRPALLSINLINWRQKVPHASKSGGIEDFGDYDHDAC